MSVDILGTSWDQCVSMVQYCFTSMETRRLVRTDSPGRPPRLSHNSWTMNLILFYFIFYTIDTNSSGSLFNNKEQKKVGSWRFRFFYPYSGLAYDVIHISILYMAWNLFDQLFTLFLFLFVENVRFESLFVYLNTCRAPHLDLEMGSKRSQWQL